MLRRPGLAERTTRIVSRRTRQQNGSSQLEAPRSLAPDGHSQLGQEGGLGFSAIPFLGGHGCRVVAGSQPSGPDIGAMEHGRKRSRLQGTMAARDVLIIRLPSGLQNCIRADMDSQEDQTRHPDGCRARFAHAWPGLRGRLPD